MMIKNEQFKRINQPISGAPIVATVHRPPPPPPPIIPPTPTEMGFQRPIDPNAIDITSLKGRFAWEKIPQSDICVPVIFRGDTKYFCVKMIKKLLPDFPEDVIRRPLQYHYRKLIDFYYVTAHEIDLLNRINSQHARGAYSRNPFTAGDEIVRVSDFLPFYEHLRQGLKAAPASTSSSVHNSLKHSLPPPPPPPQPTPQTNQRPSPSNNLRPVVTPQQCPPLVRSVVPRQPRPPTIDHSRENNASVARISLPAPSILRHLQPSKPINAPIPGPLRQQNNLLPPALPRQSSLVLPAPVPISANGDVRSTTTVSLKNAPIIVNIPAVTNKSSTDKDVSPSVQVRSVPNKSLPSPSSSTSSSSTPTPTITTNVSTSSSNTSTQAVKPSTPLSTSKTSSSPHYGWLQINKLYTPFVASINSKHYEYRIPLSLITYYDLLKRPPTETNNNNIDSKDALFPFEQIPVTAQELKVINDLCTKHNITPFTVDTKLITLATFYEHCSASLLFIKELSLNEPKSSICKEWSSIVQMKGGICRLRNINTLQEQTVPFIGTNLLMTFILSPQSLTSASLTKPTAAELEFLQLILFFSDLSINLRNSQLVDIESVKKENIVDLILLFNDKFPTNVLNYQQQENRSNSSLVPSNSSTPATNTIAESTPPPSPPSPVNNPPSSSSSSTNTGLLPLTPASTSSSSSSIVSSATTTTTPTNRFLKTIQFRGHSLEAYVCSGLGANTQRECVSIKSLCNILYPDHPQLDRLEMKMIRVLRLKNISRFRPQNLQSMGFTRLIDIREAEIHWDSLQEELKSIIQNLETPSPSVTPDVPKIEVKSLQPSPMETTVTEDKSEKRPLDESLDEEDVPVLERINKRRRLTEIDPNELMPDEESSAKKLKKTTTTSKTPSTRSKKMSLASWVKKYQIEDCCIHLDSYHSPIDMDKG